MFCIAAARKSFLHLWGMGNHLLGVGGPGAPHVFSFDRRADLGALPACINMFSFAWRRGGMRGIESSAVDSSFWSSMQLAEHPSDVILRTLDVFDTSSGGQDKALYV